MQWFYKWLGDKISNSQTENYGVESASVSLGKSSRTARVRGESDDLASDPIQFKMFKASGGWAIEFRQYDHKNDRINTSLYVVNGEQELGEHVSKIITMEALKR